MSGLKKYAKKIFFMVAFFLNPLYPFWDAHGRAGEIWKYFWDITLADTNILYLCSILVWNWFKLFLITGSARLAWWPRISKWLWQFRKAWWNSFSRWGKLRESCQRWRTCVFLKISGTQIGSQVNWIITRMSALVRTWANLKLQFLT